MKITIEMDVQFGSAWQEESHMNTLPLMIETWAIYMRMKHKKNKCSYTIKKDCKAINKTI